MPILVRRSPHSPCWKNPPANIRPNSSIIHDWWASWMSVGIIRICNTSSTELYCVLMLVLLVELEPAPGALTTRILPTRNILYRFIFVKGFDDYRPSCWINSFIRSVYVSKVLSVAFTIVRLIGLNKLTTLALGLSYYCFPVCSSHYPDVETWGVLLVN